MSKSPYTTELREKIAKEYLAGNAHYSSEFKLMCVELCLSGKMSVEEVVAKYNISAQQTLRNWIMMYNANRELKDYCPKREVYMAKA